MFFFCAASAQDTRVVTEPKYPPACSVIPATLDWNGNLPESQNTKLGTAAIQSALDKCSSGHAVVLRAHDGHAISALKREDFELTDQGQPRELTYFAVETTEVLGRNSPAD